MKKLIALVLALIYTLGLVGCDTNSSPENAINENTTSENNTADTNKPVKLTNEDEILSIALEHCKTNYDYTDITYFEDREVWEVGFWENNAKIAAQTITIDKEGNVVNVWWAE